MAFSWLAFAQRHRLDYVESGAHTQPDNIYVACPWCKDPEGKPRMGLHLLSPAWGCWRDPKHRGSDPVRLIRALLSCSWARAEEEAAEDHGERVHAEDLRRRLAALGKAPTEESSARVVMPKDAAVISGALYPPATWARNYLQRRGWPGKHADILADDYHLTVGTKGRWQNRILIPLTDLRNRLVAITGRHIGSSTLRYDTEGPTGEILYNGRRCCQRGGHTLALVEGPFDAMKVDYYGREVGLHAAGLIGLGGAGLSKVDLIAQVYRRGHYRRLLVLLDEGAQGLAQDLQRLLRPLPAERGRLPPGVKDPGELTRAQVRALAS